jgi:RHS repeat-associated protein
VKAVVFAILTGVFVATAASAVVPDTSPSTRLAVEPPLPAGHARCIVVLQRSAGKNSKDVVAETVRLGGKVEADLGDRLVVTIPIEALERLRAHALVRFIEKTVSGDAPVGGDRPELRTTSLVDVPIQTNSGQTWSSGDFTYDGSSNIVTIGTAGSAGTQGYRTYGYDSVARLTKAQINGVTPGGTYEYSYDPYGNRTGSALNQQWSTVPVSSTTNRLTDAVYDSSGNQLARGATSATYDGFSMPTSYHFDGINAETFIYTATDERIGVLRDTDWTWSLRGSDGKVLRQYRSSSTNPNASWLWVEDFVYRNGLLLGAERVAEEGGRRHYHLDHLGSPRLVTGLNGSVISEHDFLPFGEERTAIGQQMARGFDREEPFRYTGQERDFDNTQPNDSSSYLDSMHARYYEAEAGRFVSPDPVLGNLLQPQSWNRYAYVFNNPVNFTDPTGLAAARSSGGGATGLIVCDDSGCHAEITVTAEDPLGEMFRWLRERWNLGAKGIQKEVCSAIPSGRTMGISYSWGALVGGVAGGELVVNYDSGKVSAFGFTGAQAGLVLGGVSLTGTRGYVSGLNRSNSNYEGGFTTVSASGGQPFAVGLWRSWSSDGLKGFPHGSILPNGPVRGTGTSVGLSLFGVGAIAGSLTDYSKPRQLGKFWAFEPQDVAFYLVRQAACQ